MTQKAFIHLACNGRGVENDNVNVWVEVNGSQYKINHENMEIDETEDSELSCYLCIGNSGDNMREKELAADRIGRGGWSVWTRKTGYRVRIF